MRKSRFVALAVTLSACAVALGDVKDFSLLKAVPASSNIVWAVRDHKGKDFVDAQYKRVWDAVENIGIESILRKELTNQAFDAGMSLEEFDEKWEKLRDLFAAIEWSQLTEEEAVFAMRINPGAPPIEFVVVLKPKPANVDSCYQSMLDALKGVAELNEEVDFMESGEGKTTQCDFTVANQILPYALTIARQNDVLVCSVGMTMGEESIRLLNGKMTASILTNNRFKTAMSRVITPEDAICFVDVHAMLDGVRTLVKANPIPGEDPAMVVARMKVFEELDLVDYWVGVASTKDKKTTNQSVGVLLPNAKTKRLYKPIFGNKPLKDPLKMVPKEACAVTAVSGVNFVGIYDAIVDFVKKEVPGGEQQVEMAQQQWEMGGGVDLKAAFFGWIDGGFVMFEVPGRRSYGAKSSGLLLNVTDVAAAKKSIDDAIATYTPAIEEFGATIEPLPVGHCFQIRSQLLAFMGFEPTLGLVDHKLFIGNKSRPLRLLLESRESGESFADNEQYAKEGLPLRGNVMAFTFKDLSRKSQDTVGFLKGVPVILNYAVGTQFPELARSPGLKFLTTAARKLVPAAEQLDFFSSSCTVTTFDGKKWTTDGVMHYRVPPPPVDKTTTAPTKTTTDAEKKE